VYKEILKERSDHFWGNKAHLRKSSILNLQPLAWLNLHKVFEMKESLVIHISGLAEAIFF